MTLSNILCKLHKKEPFDRLEIMYRTNGPDGEDMLFGYCSANYGEKGWEIISGDGDDYRLGDGITKYKYRPDYFGGLVVWFNSEWV